VEGRGNNVEGDDEFRARSHGGHTTMSKLLKRYLYYYYYERRAPYPLSPPAKSPEERTGGARGGGGWRRYLGARQVWLGLASFLEKEVPLK
jgi:hypothetical protein